MAAILSFSLKIRGRKALIAALVAPTKAGTCPKKIGARATQGKVRLGRTTLKVRAKGPNCRAAGRLKLRRKTSSKQPITIELGGRGVVTRMLVSKP